MGLLDHLAELRSRLLKSAIAVALAFGVCWYFVDPLFDILLDPLLAVLPEGTHAQYTTLPEAFFTRMTVAFVASLFLASPVIFYQIWAFVAPGLYDEEKRYIIPIAFVSALFFAAGGAFCYFIVFPFAFKFFISYSTPEIVITPKVGDYLSFVLKLLFAFGLIFETPIFTLFLARMGLITSKMMRKAWKYAVVAIFVLAAILTPPDVVSQLLMAGPMLLLYEISIGVAAIFGKKPKKDEEDDDADPIEKTNQDEENPGNGDSTGTES
ncbi:MAG: twin-arginine translocase subunit TatC [Desulfovibrio sp.]|nr:twin-arginine translocase subunit TatC [Desulfovibrio sp.]